MSLGRQRPRTCVACREEAPTRALLRVVRAPDGGGVLDISGKLPGRGAYVCLNLDCVRRARKTGILARAIKASLTDAFWEGMERRVEDHAKGLGPEERTRELRSLLGLARRAKLILVGMDEIHAGRQGRPMLLLTAHDRSVSVSSFVDGLVSSSRDRKHGHEHLSLPLDIDALSAALGTGNVQIVALSARSGLADKVKVLLEEGGCAFEQQETGL